MIGVEALSQLTPEMRVTNAQLGVTISVAGDGQVKIVCTGNSPNFAAIFEDGWGTSAKPPTQTTSARGFQAFGGMGER